jgi:hypothetical protein
MVDHGLDFWLKDFGGEFRGSALKTGHGQAPAGGRVGEVYIRQRDSSRQ